MPFIAIMADTAVASSEKGGLPQLDVSTYPSQLFWLAVLFGVFYLMMDRVFLPALSGIIEERKNRIADDLDAAAELNRQAAGAEEAYLEALAEAKANAATIATETRAALDAEIREMQAETEAKLASELEAAETRIKALQTDATTQITAAAIETAQAIVEALIDETPAATAVTAAVAQAQS